MILLISINIILIKTFLLPVNIEPDKLFYYYTTLYYGEDKLPQAFILDTTSSLISSPCNLCATCGYHSNEWYNITNREDQLVNCENSKCKELSGTCEDNQCSYKFDYYENAFIKGVFINEKISFVNDSIYSYNITVGCTLNETNYIIAQDSDGIMGLNNDENSFINTLFKSQIIQNNLFTICLSQNNYGYFSLGEINNQYHASEQINYIPFTIDEEKYYNIKINSFELNNKELKAEVSAIIDTTASLCSFPKNIFDLIVKEYEEKCTEDSCGKLVKNKNFGVCAIFSDESEMISKIKNWLDIKINFDNYKFDWKPQNYWVNISTKHNFRACLGFESTEEDVITLGTTFLHGYDVIFDREKNKIGFVESDCNKEFNYTNINNKKVEQKKEENIFKKIKNLIVSSNKRSSPQNIVVNIKEGKEEKEGKEGKEGKEEKEEKEEKEGKEQKEGKKGKGGNILFSLLIFIIIIIVIIIGITVFYYFTNSNRRFKKKRKIRIVNKDKEVKNFLNKKKKFHY